MLFFGGGGVVGLASLYLTKEKQQYDKETQLIDRLLSEVERLDGLVKELRGYVEEEEKKADKAKRELIEERQINAELNILVLQLEEEVRGLKKQLEEASEGRTRKEDKRWNS